MMESKKGDISERIFEYILVAFIIAIIIAFIYLAVKFVMEKQCSSKINIFREDLKASLYSLGENDISEKKYFIGCNIDKIYFFDREKNISPERFAKMPILKDIIESKPKGNVLLMKNDKVFKTIDAGNFRLDYPYYLCSKPSGGLFKLLLYWTKGTSRIKNKENNLDCTYVPVYPTKDEADKIIDECEDIDICLDVSANNLKGVKENVDILRKFECDENQNKMKVKILIKTNEFKYVVDFDYIEKIPKDCVEEIKKNAINVPDNANMDFNPDPLIMWQFSKIKEETEFYYELETCLSDECKEAIEGLGIGGIQDIGTPPENHAPYITTTSIAEGLVNTQYSQVIEAKDDDGDTLVYSLVTSPSEMTINSATGIISWTPTESQIGAHQIKVSVDDGNEGTDSETFSITILKPLEATAWIISQNDISIEFRCKGDGGKEPYAYLWDFGDTKSSSEQNPTHLYDDYGRYDAECKVTDSSGESATKTIQVNIVQNSPSNNAPTITIISPQDQQEFDKGDKITFKGSVTDQDTNLKSASYKIDTGDEVQINIPYNFEFKKNDLAVGYHEIKFKAEDNGGLSAETTIGVTIKVTEPEMPSPPDGSGGGETTSPGGTEIKKIAEEKIFYINYSDYNKDFLDYGYGNEFNDEMSKHYVLIAADSHGEAVDFVYSAKLINSAFIDTSVCCKNKMDFGCTDKPYFLKQETYHDYVVIGVGISKTNGKKIEWVHACKLKGPVEIDYTKCCKDDASYGCIGKKPRENYVVVGFDSDMEDDDDGRSMAWVQTCKIVPKTTI